MSTSIANRAKVQASRKACCRRHKKELERISYLLASTIDEVRCLNPSSKTVEDEEAERQIGLFSS